MAAGFAFDRVDAARQAAASVVDPEIPVLSIADLGVLREVPSISNISPV
jgi:metal-sulfur cluster biosynthetic enzyme